MLVVQHHQHLNPFMGTLLRINLMSNNGTRHIQTIKARAKFFSHIYNLLVLEASYSTSSEGEVFVIFRVGLMMRMNFLSKECPKRSHRNPCRLVCCLCLYLSPCSKWGWLMLTDGWWPTSPKVATWYDRTVVVGDRGSRNPFLSKATVIYRLYAHGCMIRAASPISCRTHLSPSNCPTDCHVGWVRLLEGRINDIMLYFPGSESLVPCKDACVQARVRMSAECESSCRGLRGC